MSHLSHLQKNKTELLLRFEIIRAIREFFWLHRFTEVETPLILRLPGQEPYLYPISIEVKDERGKKFEGYLHTSPEYTMKKMLSAGYGDIFSICKTFRDMESFGGMHNPEFTMLEWYRVDADMYSIMDDVELLFEFIRVHLSEIPSVSTRVDNKIYLFTRLSMRDVWMKYVGVDLDHYLTDESMADLCIDKNYNIEKSEKYEDLFYRIFLNEIEPKLVEPTIIYGYPSQMAALAKLNKNDDRYADRFEVYVGGIEIANAFQELTDAEEQRKRLLDEKALRAKLRKPTFDIDEDFLEAVSVMPNSSGIALGVDRLVQVMLSIHEIDQVLPLPMSLLSDRSTPNID
jgi:elongation factor P--(R)-beta-lysine ligase